MLLSICVTLVGFILGVAIVLSDMERRITEKNLQDKINKDFEELKELIISEKNKEARRKELQAREDVAEV
jgi:hypothetical protein